jgi:hypothetical protein
MVETLADLEGMHEGTTEHPSSILPVRRLSRRRAVSLVEAARPEVRGGQRRPGHGGEGAHNIVPMGVAGASERERERGEWFSLTKPARSI